MRAIVGEGVEAPVAAACTVLAALLVISASAVSDTAPTKLVPLAMIVMLLAVSYQRLLRWPTLVAALMLVILFIPIGRYVLPASLPFQLEPYRLLAAFIITAWVTSLLIDPRVRLRPTGYEGPLGLFVFACGISLVLNPARVASVAPVLSKALMFFASFLVVVYVVSSVVRRVADVDRLLKVIVAGGAVVALSAIWESRTHYNVFNHLLPLLPLLRLGQIPFANGQDPTGTSRGGDARAYASAEHPIALGAAFAILVPLALYLARTQRHRGWWLAAGLLLAGVFATVSRTGFMMLIVVIITLFSLRPRDMKRYLPALIPAIAVIHFAVPGTLGSVVQAFFPKGGLIAQENKNAVGSGRLATLGPVLTKEFAPDPVFGEGFFTRVTHDVPGVRANAPILDDQWANVLVQTGLVGAFALLWFFVRAFRMAARRARQDAGDDAWRAAAFAASIAAYAIGMLTYDAFSFTQVTFLAFILLGMSSVATRSAPARVAVAVLAPATSSSS